jgi:hypothetical protein
MGPGMPRADRPPAWLGRSGEGGCSERHPHDRSSVARRLRFLLRSMLRNTPRIETVPTAEVEIPVHASRYVDVRVMAFGTRWKGIPEDAAPFRGWIWGVHDAP